MTSMRRLRRSSSAMVSRWRRAVDRSDARPFSPFVVAVSPEAGARPLADRPICGR